MYNKVQDEVFEGILTAALYEFVMEEMDSMPSDEEMSEIYPVSKKMLNKYKRKVKEQKYTAPISIVYIRRVAVVFLVIISMSFIVLSTNETVRAAMFDTVVTWYEKYIKFDFSKYDDSTDTLAPDDTTLYATDYTDLEILYVPSGYELSSTLEAPGQIEYIYSSASGDYMLIGIYSSENTGITSDIELSTYEITSINQYDAYLLYNDTERTGSLIFGNSKYTIIITALSSKDDLIKVAENIK